MRVLIVDDEVLIRHVTAMALQEIGCRTDEAVNGQEAIDSITLSCPDLVVLDLLMPVKTGYDVLDWLQTHPAGERVQVIILSGFTAELDEFELHPQVCAVLQKPMMVSELRHAVESCTAYVETAYEPA